MSIQKLPVIEYEIIGDPIPLARPRMSYTSHHIYDEQRLLKRAVMHEILSQHRPRPLYNGPCLLEVTFFLRIPKKSLSVTQKQEGKYHIQRPDLDNLVKFIGEITQMRDDDEKPLLLNDDSLISKIVASKVYSITPRTIFTITELK